MNKLSFSYTTTLDEVPRLDKRGYRTRYKDLDVEVTVYGIGTPGRPPPPCSNPDFPAFSDAGDPAEIEVQEVVRNDTRMDLYNALSPAEIESIEQLVYGAMERGEEVVGGGNEPDTLEEARGER